MFGRQSLSFRRIARAFPPRGRASALRHLALGVSRIALLCYRTGGSALCLSATDAPGLLVSTLLNGWVTARQTGNRITFRVRYDAKRGQAGHASGRRSRIEFERLRALSKTGVRLPTDARQSHQSSRLRLADDADLREKPRLSLGGASFGLKYAS